MDTAGFPYRFWSYAAKHYQHNRTRMPDATGQSPFVQRFGFEDPQELVPFGCLAYFHHDEHLKYEGRGREGAIIGYDSHSAYLVLDVRRYVESGGHQVSIFSTRDVRIDRWRMPMRAHSLATEEEAE